MSKRILFRVVVIAVVDHVDRRLVGLEGRRFGFGLGIDLGIGMRIGMWLPQLPSLFGPYLPAVLAFWLCSSEKD